MSSPTVTITLKAEDLATDKIRAVSSNTEQAAQRVNEQTKQLNTSTKDLAMGFTAAGAAAFSMVSQLNYMQRIELGLEKSHKQVESATLAVSKAQEEVTKLQQEGKQGTLDYQQAVEKLSVAQQGLGIATDLQRIREMEKNQAMVSFGLSIVPTVMAGYQGISTVMKAATLANKELTISMLFSPWGIVAIAIGAVVAAIYVITDGFTNFKPIVDAVNASIKWLLDRFADLLDIIGYLVPAAKDAANFIRNLHVDVGQLGNIIPTASAHSEVLAENLGNVGTAAKEAGKQIDIFRQDVEKPVDFSKLFGGFAEQGIAGPFQTVDPTKSAEFWKNSLERGKQTKAEWDRAITTHEKQETDKRISLQDLYFNNFTSKSEAFKGDLASTSATITELLSRGTKSGLDAALKEMAAFANQWKLTWAQAINFVQQGMSGIGRSPGAFVGQTAESSFQFALAGGGVAATGGRTREEALSNLIKQGFNVIQHKQEGGFITKGGLFMLHAGEAVTSKSDLAEIKDYLRQLAMRTISLQTTMNVSLNSSQDIGKLTDAARGIGREQLQQSDLFKPFRLT